MNEIAQLKSMATILPTVFLVVAAFLSNMVMARLIAIERGEIGLIKAFGYSNAAVGWHYTKMVMVICGLGIVIGWAVGAWLGRYNTEVYATLYRFPFLLFRPGPWSFAIAGLVSLASALAGSLGAVRQAVRMPPAEAMRPPAPPLYRHARRGAWRIVGWLDQPTRIVLRQLVRWPLRALMTLSGIAMAVAVLVTSMQWIDSINDIADLYFREAQRQTLTVALVEPREPRVMAAFRRLPGVLMAEPGRVVAATLRVGNRRHRGAVQGIVAEPRLNLIYDTARTALSAHSEGLVLSKMLARKLGVGRGDRVRVEVLEGRRPVRWVPVAALFDTHIGTPAYMNLAALNRLMEEGPRVGHAHLLVDGTREATLFRALKDMPAVSAVTLKRAGIDTFNETMGETVLTFIGFFIVFACTLAIGVAYNAARIALSERGRELATLRVLGFRRGEIAYILLGEIGLLVFAALPTGCLAGYGLAWLISESFETELFRVPLIVTPATFGWAVIIATAAAVVAAALVRRRLDRLDLIAVLKTRE